MCSSGNLYAPGPKARFCLDDCNIGSTKNLCSMITCPANATPKWTLVMMPLVMMMLVIMMLMMIRRRRMVMMMVFAMFYYHDDQRLLPDVALPQPSQPNRAYFTFQI